MTASPPPVIVVAGTDTGVGKTVLSAALASALGAAYWKPVQAGLDGETDSETAQRLGGLAASQILPEVYRLRLPASPHIAAAVEGVTIDSARLSLPAAPRPLVVETAGGLMVPLTDTYLQIDQIAAWRAPVVLVARTALGTINHSLLSLEALRTRGIAVLGVAFIGHAEPEVEATIVRLGKVMHLGRLDWREPLTPAELAASFAEGFGDGPLGRFLVLR